MRTNGFQAPYNSMQITTWFLLPILILQYILFTTLTLPTSITAPLTTLYLISALFTCYYGYVTTKTDAIDEHLYLHLNGHMHPIAAEKRQKIEEEREKYRQQREHRRAQEKSLQEQTLKEKSEQKEETSKQADLSSIQNTSTDTSMNVEPGNSEDNVSIVSNTLSSISEGISNIFSRSQSIATTKVLGNDPVKTETTTNNINTTDTEKDVENGTQNQSKAEDKDDDDDDDDVTLPPLPTPELKYCWVCQTQVGKLSMHCKYCDKCVGTFDHHCMWLNTCVGELNYPTFYKTIWSTLTFALIHFVTLIIFLILYYGDWMGVVDKSRDWFGAGKPALLVAFNIIFLVITGFSVFLVAQLVAFHIGLRRNNLTTYQYIVNDGVRKREKNSFKQRVHIRREEDLKVSEGCPDTFMLTVGKYKICRRCDPVRREVMREDVLEQEERQRQQQQISNSFQSSAHSDDDPDSTALDDDKLTSNETGDRLPRPPSTMRRNNGSSSTNGQRSTSSYTNGNTSTREAASSDSWHDQPAAESVANTVTKSTDVKNIIDLSKSMSNMTTSFSDEQDDVHDDPIFIKVSPMNVGYQTSSTTTSEPPTIPPKDVVTSNKEEIVLTGTDIPRMDSIQAQKNLVNFLRGVKTLKKQPFYLDNTCTTVATDDNSLSDDSLDIISFQETNSTVKRNTSQNITQQSSGITTL